MKHLYFLFRWFGLDTICCVVILQLYLGTLDGQFNVIKLVGICSGVSFIYLIDRYRDLVLNIGVNNRHAVYEQNINWVIGSGAVLFTGAFLCWLFMSSNEQFVLSVCVVCVLFHLWFLKYQRYIMVKDWCVSFIFTTVMMLGRFEFLHMWGIIFFSTFFNVTIHRLIEMGIKWSDGFILCMVIICMMCLVYVTIGYSLVWLFWGLSILGQLSLLKIGQTSQFWYELGELFYILPFFLMLIY